MSTILEDVNALVQELEQRAEQVEERPEGCMIFTCETYFPEAIQHSLLESDVVPVGLAGFKISQYKLGAATVLHLVFPDDTLFREVSSWSQDLYGCHLITRPHIER